MVVFTFDSVPVKLLDSDAEPPGIAEDIKDQRHISQQLGKASERIEENEAVHLFVEETKKQRWDEQGSQYEIQSWANSTFGSGAGEGNSAAIDRDVEVGFEAVAVANVMIETRVSTARVVAPDIVTEG
ncbi:hypothetical protein BGZ54_000667, partial [Gamsiella multidivaricata]